MDNLKRTILNGKCQNRSFVLFAFFIDMPISNIFIILSYKYSLERDTHASMLIEMGFDILEISERLGHELVKTTLDTYSHLYPEKDTKLVKELNKLRRPSAEPKESY